MIKGGGSWIEYPFMYCNECITKLDIRNREINCKDDLLITKEKERCVYFAPVGNQFNFGIFSSGKTPKVIIMGITTSPTACENFTNDLKDFHKNNLDFYESLRLSCISNIFNSDRENLQVVLTKILNKTGINRLIGCAGEMDISKDFFKNNSDNADYSKVINKIYFTQMIMCASCFGKDGSRAPTNINELGPFQNRCIESQLNFIDSFDAQVDLLISFGYINSKILDEYDTKKVVARKCKHHVNIPHPTTKGWNEINLMNFEREKFIQKIDKIIEGDRIKNKPSYKTSLINCYDKLNEIKKAVELISKSI